MINNIALDLEIRKDARELVRLTDRARQAMRDGNLHAASELWLRREELRYERSYLMRVLWSQRWP
jgi:hypothetical protein